MQSLAGPPPIAARGSLHGDRTAIVTTAGSFCYDDLLAASRRAALAILALRSDLEQGRVAYLVPPGFEHVAVQWGIWRAGGVAVPLAVSHPPPELDFVLADSDPELVIASPELGSLVGPLARARGIRFLTTSEVLATDEGDRVEGSSPPSLPPLQEARPALMIYTSGTTGRPKGVVTTHANLRAQVVSLVEAWAWSPEDRILHVLPLHHVHGIVNALSCALWVGATCEMHPRFEARVVWERLAQGGVTLLMGVPTMYQRLISAWEEASPGARRAWSEGARKLRLMVSGSAALPVTTLQRWQEITGHVLLERYGMTEIGMALSNPLDGERVPGHVGAPLPGVSVRLVDEAGNEAEPGTPGEIHVRGPAVFGEYWRRPDETRRSFDGEWFRTGDIAVEREGVYRILGRRSQDIIKTGGFKVSALEVEEALRGHPRIKDCAVVATADPEWGEKVSVALVLDRGKELELQTLREWAKMRLAPYKVPRALLVVDELPRNAMGKVMKPTVQELFRESET